MAMAETTNMSCVYKYLDLFSWDSGGGKIALYFPHCVFFQSCSYGYIPSKKLRVVEND